MAWTAVGLALSFPALAQQARSDAGKNDLGGFVRGGAGGFPASGASGSWVFTDDGAGKDDAAAALDKASRDVDALTRGSLRLMDDAAGASEAADRMDRRMGLGVGDEGRR